MAIRYVDIEPGDGKAKPAKAPKPAPEAHAPEADPAEEARDAAAAPTAKPKRRKK